MRLFSLVSAALAVASAVALGSLEESVTPKRAIDATAVDDDVVEHVIFKRGDVLAPRDIQQAEELGVDLEQMFRHSMIKRSDGEEITFWVHNSWQDAPAEIEKRQQNLHVWGSKYHKGWASYQCATSIAGNAWDRTFPNSPYTGGVNNIITWGRRHRGAFDLPSGCCPWASDIIISGSNSGGNAAFAVQPWVQSSRFLLGSEDISDAVEYMRNRYQKQYSGIWRVAGGGWLDCDVHGHRSRVMVDWVIQPTTKRAGN